MTISSLAKTIVGVNRMVVENVEIEYPEINPTLIVRVKPTKKDSCRCGICGKKCSGYDQGNGKRRWRSLDHQQYPNESVCKRSTGTISFAPRKGRIMDFSRFLAVMDGTNGNA